MTYKSNFIISAIPKFEDRCQEESERPERCARGDAWTLAKKIYKLKEKDKATFFSLSDISTTKREERVCVVDSRASMHMAAGKPLTLPNWKP